MRKISSSFAQISEQKFNLIVFFTCILIGILSGIKFYNQAPSGDAKYYFQAANMIKEDFFVLFNTPRIGVVESMNAIILGITMIIPGNDFINVYGLQILIFAFTGWLIFRLGVLFIGRTGALISVFIYLINNKNWECIYNFKPGIWVNLFLISTIYFVYKTLYYKKEVNNYIYTAIFAALLLLTDLRYLPHILFIYLILLFSNQPLINKVKSTFISALIIIVIITPWIVREYIVFDKFIFISDIHTVTINKVFNTRNYQLLKLYKPLAIMPLDTFESNFWKLREKYHLTPGEMTWARIASSVDSCNQNKAPIADHYKELIDQGIFNADKISHIIYKEENKSPFLKRIEAGLFLWAPFKFSYSYDPLSEKKSFRPPASLLNNLNRFFTLGILLPFLIIGLFILLANRNLFGIILAGIFLIHTLVHAFTFVQWRYILPILPLITLVSVFGIKMVFHQFKKPRNNLD